LGSLAALNPRGVGALNAIPRCPAHLSGEIEVYETEQQKFEGKRRQARRRLFFVDTSSQLCCELQRRLWIGFTFRQEFRR
jgi:hypothetical protein